MAKEGKTKIYNLGQSRAIRIPAEVFNDSSFPFIEKDNITAKITGKKIVFEKTEED